MRGALRPRSAHVGLSNGKEFFLPRKLSLGEKKRESEYERDDTKRRDLVFVTLHSSVRHSEYYALGCESQKAV